MSEVTFALPASTRKGDKVRIPKGSLVYSTNPRKKKYRTARSVSVKVLGVTCGYHQPCEFGSSLGHGARVLWSGQGDFVYETEVTQG